MAYDANDPADRKIVEDAVKAERERLENEHETEVEGLRSKNTELLGKLRKARQGGEGDSGEVELLENELSEVQGKLRKAESDLRQAGRDLANVTTERDTARGDLTREQEFSRNEVINNGLTKELLAANVQPQFLEDVTASLSRQVTVKEVDGKRQAFVGDKSLGDFVKEWSQGDRGKHYVSAPANGGGGAGDPGKPQGGDKKIWQMNDAERVAAHNANPTDFQRRVEAGEGVKPPEAKA